MAVNDVYRLSVDYTLATQVTSPTSGKTAFVPMIQFYSGGTAFDVAITSPLGTKAIAAAVAVTPATSSSWAVTAAQLPASVGTKAASASLSVVSATLENETVAASQTAQVLGGSGAIGDILSYIIISPATTSPGNVIILDNATPIYTFAGGASSVPSLVPIIVPFGTPSASGAWKVTTGADVSVTAFGDFT